jgi:hypothetical protein
MADCLAGRGCPFTGSVDDAMADLGTLLAGVDATPLKASDGRMLGAGCSRSPPEGTPCRGHRRAHRRAPA